MSFLFNFLKNTQLCKLRPSSKTRLKYLGKKKIKTRQPSNFFFSFLRNACVFLFFPKKKIIYDFWMSRIGQRTFSFLKTFFLSKTKYFSLNWSSNFRLLLLFGTKQKVVKLVEKERRCNNFCCGFFFFLIVHVKTELLKVKKKNCK